MEEDKKCMDLNVDENGDYIFRFRLDELPPDEPIYEDRLTEFVRSQLAALLEAVILTQKGEQVKVDGFCFMNEPDKIYSIWKSEKET